MSVRKAKPKHFLPLNVIQMRDALRNRDPLYSGICAIPDYQRTLYYTHGDALNRVDFSNATSDDLDALYRACKPAEFGLNGENVLDPSYRKAGKMDLGSFATLFDPRSLGIHEQVSKALLVQSHATMELELYKLNVYGKGDFFKAHKDTPRSQDMLGSLVVVLPTVHEGGELVLRRAERTWTFDFAPQFGKATEPSACFVAFYGELEHEVLPITLGHRVTLTYNLYHKSARPDAPLWSSSPTPFHVQLKQALVDLVNDESKLPKGGYFGFGLTHEYVHTGRNLVEPLLGQLKGSDRALADVCDALGLPYFLRLFYRITDVPGLSFVTTEELDVEDELTDASSREYLASALDGLTIDIAEGVVLVGWEGEPRHNLSPFDELDEFDRRVVQPFFKDPITEVLEVTPMKSSLSVKSPILVYGNEATLEYFYGTACMLIAVGPAETRRLTL